MKTEMEKKIMQVQVWGMFSTETELVTNYPVKEQLEKLEKFLEQYKDISDVSVVGYLVLDEGELNVKAILILENGGTTISLIQFIPEYDPSKPAVMAIDLEGRFLRKDEAIELFGEYIECVQKTIEDDDHIILGYLVDYKSTFPQVKIDALIAVKLKSVKSTVFRVISIVPPSQEIKEACNL